MNNCTFSQFLESLKIHGHYSLHYSSYLLFVFHLVFILVFKSYMTLYCIGQGYDSIIPSIPDDVSGDSHNLTKKLADKVAAYIDQYIEAMEKVVHPHLET